MVIAAALNLMPRGWRYASLAILIIAFGIMADIVWGEGCNKAL